MVEAVEEEDFGQGTDLSETYPHGRDLGGYTDLVVVGT